MIKYILAALVIITLAIVGITIGANNDQMITFNYAIAQSELRLSTLVAILFGFGLILGWLITGIFYLRLKLQNMALNRRVKRQAQQISELTSPKAEYCLNYCSFYYPLPHYMVGIWGNVVLKRIKKPFKINFPVITSRGLTSFYQINKKKLLMFFCLCYKSKRQKTKSQTTRNLKLN